LSSFQGTRYQNRKGEVNVSFMDSQEKTTVRRRIPVDGLLTVFLRISEL
jgi:hypothetical protein